MRDKEDVRLGYDAFWAGFDRGLNRHERDRFAAVISRVRRLQRPNSAILEAGCGLGKLAERLRLYGEVTAADWSGVGIEGARQRGGDAFVVLDLVRDDMKAYENRFGLVVSTEVLEHVGRENRLAFARNLFRCLVVGGHLLLTTPNRLRAERLPENDQSRQPEEDLLSPQETHAVLREAGFSLLASGSATFFEELWEASATFRRLRSLFRRDELGRDPIDRLLANTRLGVYTVIHAKKSGPN